MWVPLALSLLLGLATALLTIPLLRRVPEPTDVPATERPGYARLATGGFAAAVGVCTTAATALVTLRLPATVWPVWLGLLGLGSLLICIDAATTWLPLWLTRPLWLVTALGGLAVTGLAGWRSGLRLLLGALACLAFWWLVWRVVGGIGFGDVRLAPVLGACAAAAGWGVLFWSVLLGTLAGALFGLARAALGRRGLFPYGPPLLMGQLVAVAWFGSG
ncbi:hypothetical protein HJ590_02775 [Naumannella sp. ID2617S]|nr:hypothetical protein [Naumannella sp. ID2617S]